MDDKGNHIAPDKESTMTKYSLVGAILSSYDIQKRTEMDIWVKIKTYLGLEDHETITDWETSSKVGYSDVLYLIDHFDI